MNEAYKEFVWTVAVLLFLGYVLWLFFGGLQYARETQQIWPVLLLLPMGIGLGFLSDMTKLHNQPMKKGSRVI